VVNEEETELPYVRRLDFSDHQTSPSYSFEPIFATHNEGTTSPAPCVSFDTSDLHKSPYVSHFEKAIAKISIHNRCYGRELARVIELVRGAVGASFDVTVRSLAAHESAALHPGMVFTKHTIKVHQPQDLPPAITALYPVEADIRADLSAAVVEMVTRPYIWPHLHLRYSQLKNPQGQRVFQGFYSGNAWRSIQAQIGEHCDLVGLLLFSDSTQILRFGNRTLHPIYMAPAGLDIEHMGLSCMSLIGFMPTCPSSTRDLLTESQKRRFAAWSRHVLASVYAHIITMIHRHMVPGIVVSFPNFLVRKFHPFVLTAISDHPEGNNIALLDNLACRYCTTEKDMYASTDEVGPPRTSPENIDQSHDHPLLQPEILPFRPFRSAHCIFHDVDEGIWKWLIDEVILPLFPSAADQHVLASRIAMRSRFPGMQHLATFSEASLKFLTARQLRQQLVQMAVTMASWTFVDRMKDKAFLAIIALCKWYCKVRCRACHEGDLEDLARLTVQLRIVLRAAFPGDYASKAIKHHVILHYPQLVREYGTMLYQSCEMFDSAHRFMIKWHLVSHGSTNFQQVVERRVSSRAKEKQSQQDKQPIYIPNNRKSDDCLYSTKSRDNLRRATLLLKNHHRLLTTSLATGVHFRSMPLNLGGAPQRKCWQLSKPMPQRSTGATVTIMLAVAPFFCI
jgi:hypothetical protein